MAPLLIVYVTVAFGVPVKVSVELLLAQMVTGLNATVAVGSITASSGVLTVKGIASTSTITSPTLYVTTAHLGSITASGGPFFGKKFKDLKDISLSDAMKHPIWSMGIKNTIDSATMANKVLELLEAMNLFNIKENMIDVFVNKQSIVHASVGLKSGGVISFSSKPDMKSHIGHAIMFPEYEEEFSNPLNGTLEFAQIKKEEFPLFFIGREVAKSQDSSKFTIFNVANQVAVEKFCKGRVKYTQILEIVTKALNEKILENAGSIEELSLQIQKLERELSKD